MYPRLTDDDAASLAEWNFVRTFEDLEQRTDAIAPDVDRYLVLGIAPLLRKLLLDNSALVHIVNKTRHVKLEFVLNEFPLTLDEARDLAEATLPPDEVLSYWRVFLPDQILPHPGNVGAPVGKDKFLGSTFGYLCGRAVTARALIKFYCEVEGGVHVGTGRNQIEKDLIVTAPSELITPTFGVVHSPIASLFFIGKIALEALRPLYEAIQAAPLTPSMGALHPRMV